MNRQVIITAALLLSLSSPVLAGGLVYDLSGPGGGGIYKVERDGSGTTKVFGLTPGTADVTLGIRTGNGDRIVIGPPGRQDEFAKGLAVEPGDSEDGDGN